MIKTLRWLALMFFAMTMNSALPCLAQPFDLKFGPEFTFTDQYQSREVSTKQYVKWLKRHLLRKQTDEAKFNISRTTHGGPTFTSPNGWSFQVTKDPGVIEIKMAPLRLSKWKKFSADIQDAIFVSAYNTDFFPADFQGGGHISIDLTELYKHPLLLRNFIVDFWNHNELSMGVFGYDTHNAIPLNLMDPTIINYIKEVVQKYDRFFTSSQEPTESWSKSLVADLNMEMYHTRDQYSDFWNDIGWLGRQKLFALSFWDVRNNRMEFRSVRPQKNIEVWLAQISLINARINYLTKFAEPIPFEVRVPIKRPKGPLDIKERALNPPVDPKIALKSFFIYVQESGEDWFNHRSYLWPDWIQSGAVDAFERSSWFKKRYVKPCGKLL